MKALAFVLVRLNEFLGDRRRWTFAALGLCPMGDGFHEIMLGFAFAGHGLNPWLEQLIGIARAIYDQAIVAGWRREQVGIIWTVDDDLTIGA